MPTTVYDKSATLAGTDDGAGDANLNVRQVLKAAVLSSATGTQARLTVLFGTACGTITGAITNVYIGQAAATGNAYDFNGNQVQVLFGGAATVNGAASSSVTSDFVTLGEAYDNTKNYVVSFHGKSGATTLSLAFAAVTNVDVYFDSGAGGDTASQTIPSPLTSSTLANSGDFVTKLEIQAPGGPFPQLEWGAQKDLFGVTPQHYVRSPSQFPNPIPFLVTGQSPPNSIRLSAPQQQLNNLLLQTVVATSPFYTKDFSNPFIPIISRGLQPTNINIFTNPIPFLNSQPNSRSVWYSAPQQQLNTIVLPTPFAQYDWSHTLERTILSDSNLPNIVLLNPAGTPFSQLSWPRGSAVPQAPFDVVNMVLFTPDVTPPFAQYDWSHGEFLPSIPSPVIELNTNLFTNPIPFNQLNWTKYYRTITPGLDSLPNISLLNQVVTNPFFSQDFSRPFVPPRAAVDVQSVNTNLFTNSIPLNQIDWSKPYRIVPITSDQNSLPNLILYQPVVVNPSTPLGLYSWEDLYKYVKLYPNTPALLPNLTLILPPPPPDTGPVGGWRWIDGVMRMREKRLDRRDQSRDIQKAAAVLSKLGGIARAQALTSNQRSNIASKAAQARWNPSPKRK